MHVVQDRYEDVRAVIEAFTKDRLGQERGGKDQLST